MRTGVQTSPCLEAATSMLSPCSVRVLCRCLGVTEQDVQSALDSGEIQTLQDLMSRTQAGSGCTACHHVLRSYLAARRESCVSR